MHPKAETETEIKAENHLFMKSPDGLITSKVLSKMYKLGNIPEMENYAYYFGLIADKNAKKPDESSGDAVAYLLNKCPPLREDSDFLEKNENNPLHFPKKC